MHITTPAERRGHTLGGTDSISIKIATDDLSDREPLAAINGLLARMGTITEFTYHHNSHADEGLHGEEIDSIMQILLQPIINGTRVLPQLDPL